MEMTQVKRSFIKNTSRQAQKAQKHMGEKHHVHMARKKMQLALS